jgi:hypothetical protein
MVAATRYGWTVVAFGILGVAAGLTVALTAHVAMDRVGLFVSAGLVAGAALLALFDVALVRPVLDRPVPATSYEKLPQPVIENGMRITHRPVPAIDPISGEPILARPRSTLFGLGLLSWSAVLGGIGLIVALSNMLAQPA